MRFPQWLIVFARSVAMLRRLFLFAPLTRKKPEPTCDVSDSDLAFITRPHLSDKEFGELMYRLIHGREPDPFHLALLGWRNEDSPHECLPSRISFLFFLLNSEEFKAREQKLKERGHAE